MPLSAISSLEPGHAPTRPLARCSATRRSSHPRPSRTRGSSLLSMRATETSRARLVRPRSWGCALRRFDPVDGWSRRTSAAAKSVATFLPDRAHVPFAPPRPHPINFRRVISPAALDTRRQTRVIERVGRSADSCGVDFWASLPSAVRRAITRPRVDPALGFASCRVVGHVSVHRAGLDPDAIINLRRPHARSFFVRPRALLSAHGFGGVLPDRNAIRSRQSCATRSHFCDHMSGCCRHACDFAAPFSVLMGLMPCFTRPAFDARAGLAPCLRFCTVREER